MTLAEVTVGMKFRVHPGTDAFMMGLTWGTVTKVGRRWVHAEIRRLDIVRTVRILPENMLPFEEG